MPRTRTITMTLAASLAIAATPALGAVGDVTVINPAVTGPALRIDSMATGPSGNLWFTLSDSLSIGRMNPQTRASTQFDLLQDQCAPQSIALGPDGAMWFGCGDGRVGRITTAGAVTYYATDFNGSRSLTPVGSVITGPDGNIWFAQFDVSTVGVMSTSGSMRNRIQVSARPGVSGLTVGGDGNVWASFVNGLQVYRITPAGSVRDFQVGSQLGAIATASTGDVWGAPTLGTAEIQVVNPSGSASGIPLGAFTEAIARGPLGYMWLPDRGGAQIDRVAADGATLRFGPGVAWAADFRTVAAGSDGNMWTAGNPDPAGQATLFRVLTGAVPTVLAVPSISGTASAGSTLTATTGAWTYTPTSYAYRWERCTTATSGCIVISGATGAKYKVTSADAGRYLRAGIVATNLNGASARAFSNSIADSDTVTPGGGGTSGGGTSGGGTSQDTAYAGPEALGINTLLWTRGSSTKITTRYRVAGAGHFAQSATARGITLCSTSRNVTAAGTYTATCTLRPAARAQLRSRSLRVTVTSTYTQDGLPTAIAQVRLTLPRSGVTPVTG